VQKQLQPLAFSIRQAACAAQVSETFMRAVIRTGKLRAVNLGRCWRIPRSEVLWICGESGEAERNRSWRRSWKRLSNRTCFVEVAEITSFCRIPTLKENPQFKHRGPRTDGEETFYVATAGMYTPIRHQMSIGSPFPRKAQVGNQAAPKYPALKFAAPRKVAYLVY
jgi:excisionase family DNA binding protein